jgi:glycosyltransferase involved in cell wall biosynthesis
MRVMDLSIVIPAFNEEKRIGRMLDAYLPYFAEHYGDAVEFLVVINGSTDETERVVLEREGRYPQLRHLVEPARIGKGGAIVLGFREAVGNLIGFVDADGATAPQSFDGMAKACDGMGAVIGSRWIKGAEVVIKQSVPRRIASRGFNLAVRLLFGLNIHDTQCGAKIFSRDALAVVMDRIGTLDWAIDVDLLFQLRRAGYRIRETPVVWRDVGGSGSHVVGIGVGLFAGLVRLRLAYSPFRFLVKRSTPSADVSRRWPKSV